MAVRFADLVQYTYQNKITELVDNFNSMIEATSIRQTTSIEINNLLRWLFASTHKLNNLNWLDEDGNTIDLITSRAAEDFIHVIEHNFIGLVNSYRQVLIFMSNEGGKSVSETKVNPINNRFQTTETPTITARVDYTPFSSASVSDEGLKEVSRILGVIYNEYTQYLDIFGGDY